jgi:hypothetical protein
MTKPIYFLIFLIIVLLFIYLTMELNIKEGSTTGDNTGTDNKTRYNLDNLDVKYHDDPETLNDSNLLANKSSYVLNKDGKIVPMTSSGIGVSTNYYKPGQFAYTSQSYVPNYEDSVFLSRTADLSYKNHVSNTASIKGGFCNYFSKNMDEIEKACLESDPNVCASTSCCVLLGGSKCVGGSQNGPNYPANYSDANLPNKDYYYFQGKCYGNCPKY